MSWKHLDNVGFVVLPSFYLPCFENFLGEPVGCVTAKRNAPKLLRWWVIPLANPPYETVTQASKLSTVFAVPSLN